MSCLRETSCSAIMRNHLLIASPPIVDSVSLCTGSGRSVDCLSEHCSNCVARVPLTCSLWPVVHPPFLRRLLGRRPHRLSPPTSTVVRGTLEHFLCPNDCELQCLAAAILDVFLMIQPDLLRHMLQQLRSQVFHTAAALVSPLGSSRWNRSTRPRACTFFPAGYSPTEFRKGHPCLFTSSLAFF